MFQADFDSVQEVGDQVLLEDDDVVDVVGLVQVVDLLEQVGGEQISQCQKWEWTKVKSNPLWSQSNDIFPCSFSSN